MYTTHPARRRFRALVIGLRGARGVEKIAVAEFVRAFFAWSYLLVGLSHFLHPRLWQRLFLSLRQNEFAPLVIAGLTFPLGLVIVLAHNFWDWHPAVFVTIAGWMMVIKSVVYALVPGAFRRVVEANLDDTSPARTIALRTISLTAVGLCVWILVDLYFWQPAAQQ